jgi:hypothetical protein
LQDVSDAEERIQAALDSIQGASTQQIDEEIDKVALQLTSTATGSKLTLTTPTGAKREVEGWPRSTLYLTTGTHTDGAMTQKAITDALSALETSLTQKINAIPSGGGSGSGSSSGGGGISNLGADAAGRIVIVGSTGEIVPGDVTEEMLVKLLIKSNAYSAKGTVGVITDYINKSYERSQDAMTLHAGTEYDSYAMYGGRMRCNVADNGEITAFYGDANYKEDGSNGQVMIYQPKFYYQRTYLKDAFTSSGYKIEKESLTLAPQETIGFKLHPLFKNGAEELDYVLLPAYEGSVFDVSENAYMVNNESGVDFAADKLCSIAGVKPLTGASNQITAAKFQSLAANRGEGWQLTTAEAESALQMLVTVEFGTMNSQSVLEKGLVNVNRSGTTDCRAITGSTSSLGNSTGAAEITIIDKDGSRSQQSMDGQRAVSYRGMENPWGDAWRIIGNMTVRGTGSNRGGIPYYNEIPLNIQLPVATAEWISAMGYYNPDFDWLYIPIECASNANSAVPVGDALWTTNNLNGTNLFAVGGAINSGEGAGIFHYSADISITSNPRNFNGRIMYVPTKNSIYQANIEKWHEHYGE